ncbi:MAG: hypothetical protein NVS3B3_06620 [Aquirhabdus sp.]
MVQHLEREKVIEFPKHRIVRIVKKRHPDVEMKLLALKLIRLLTQLIFTKLRRKD